MFLFSAEHLYYNDYYQTYSDVITMYLLEIEMDFLTIQAIHNLLLQFKDKY